MTKLKLSVVMPVFNGEKYIKKSLESILKQELRDFELIIVDDGSLDKTTDIINSIKDKRIKLIKNSKNLGLSTSINKGIKAAKGKYVARCDGDDLYSSNRFKLQLDFLERHPEYILIGSNADIINPRDKKIGEIITPEKSYAIKKQLLAKNNIIHPSVIYNKEAVQKAGWYREFFNLGAEEYDLWFRLMAYGKFYNIQKKLIKRRVHDQVYTKKNHWRVELMAIIVRFINLPNYLKSIIYERN
jgi:glycosyltransferase involved in cell wall biosynthesis